MNALLRMTEQQVVELHAALHNGDFATYGKEIQMVGNILNQLAALQSPAPSPSASPKASP